MKRRSNIGNTKIRIKKPRSLESDDRTIATLLKSNAVVSRSIINCISDHNQNAQKNLQVVLNLFEMESERVLARAKIAKIASSMASVNKLNSTRSIKDLRSSYELYGIKTLGNMDAELEIDDLVSTGPVSSDNTTGCPSPSDPQSDSIITDKKILISSTERIGKLDRIENLIENYVTSMESVYDPDKVASDDSDECLNESDDDKEGASPSSGTKKGAKKREPKRAAEGSSEKKKRKSLAQRATEDARGTGSGPAFSELRVPGDPSESFFMDLGSAMSIRKRRRRKNQVEFSVTRDSESRRLTGLSMIPLLDGIDMTPDGPPEAYYYMCFNRCKKVLFPSFSQWVARKRKEKDEPEGADKGETGRGGGESNSNDPEAKKEAGITNKRILVMVERLEDNMIDRMEAQLNALRSEIRKKIEAKEVPSSSPGINALENLFYLIRVFLAVKRTKSSLKRPAFVPFYNGETFLECLSLSEPKSENEETERLTPSGEDEVARALKVQKSKLRCFVSGKKVVTPGVAGEEINDNTQPRGFIINFREPSSLSGDTEPQQDLDFEPGMDQGIEPESPKKKRGRKKSSASRSPGGSKGQKKLSKKKGTKSGSSPKQQDTFLSSLSKNINNRYDMDNFRIQRREKFAMFLIDPVYLPVMELTYFVCWFSDYIEDQIREFIKNLPPNIDSDSDKLIEYQKELRNTRVYWDEYHEMLESLMAKIKQIFL